jgi:hypothetical protein
MTPNRSLFRVAALAGVAAFLFSFASVSPAAAQTSTRHVATCVALATDGVSSAQCSVTVPAGKVFIVESATFGGFVSANQFLRVRLATKKGGETFLHYVPAGAFPEHNLNTDMWTGALPGTIFGEPGPMRLEIWRTPHDNQAWIQVTLSGRLEDM